MKIIADTATLLSPQEGQALGMTIVPVCVSISGQTYKDYVEISSDEFLQKIEEGGVPTSSQPSVGDVLEVLEGCREEVVMLTVGDGLSGAYQTAMGAKNCIEDNDHIHIVNSKTLAGPLRYLAKKAAAMNKQGRSLKDILSALEEGIESSISFVVPADFDFLKRSGRLTAITARVGGVLNLLPVLTQTEDKTRIKPVGVKRSWKTAIESILQKLDITKDHLISICHANTPQRAADVLAQVRAAFPHNEVEILQLSPALITHGGPGCIVIQAVKK